jgi:hypothetical protein
MQADKIRLKPRQATIPRSNRLLTGSLPLVTISAALRVFHGAPHLIPFRHIVSSVCLFCFSFLYSSLFPRGL